jgi:imidazoleglycerol-phosphate dehydratase/histidinol-phosphatase
MPDCSRQSLTQAREMADRWVFVIREGGLLQRSTGTSLDSLRLQDGCMAALARFRDAGYGLVLLVDGADAGGSEADSVADGLQTFLSALFATQGIRFAAVKSCPHGSAAGCDCALPGIGLVEEYVADAGLDRKASILVGDADATSALARVMGIQACRLGEATSWPDIAHAVLDRPRRAEVVRKTRETDIRVSVDLDRAAEPEISTGIGFFDHMLEQLGKHGGFELKIACSGDLEVDEHHTIEDVALALGQAIREALGDKRGIGRYGFLLAMDEAEAQVAIDLSGRAYPVFEGEFPREAVGGLPTELVGHFFRSLADALGAALHVSIRGDNAHHMVEACFKGVARALRQALARSGSELPSTKGTL